MPEEYANLEARVTKLEEQFKKLKDWSDLNDYWLREMIDALAESVERNHTDIQHNADDIKLSKQKQGE